MSSRRLPTIEEEYDCVKCGACCATNWQEDHYVTLNEEDVRRLTDEDRERLIIYIDGEDRRPAMRTRYNRRGELVCAALQGFTGCRVSCSIYEDRPDACRRFSRGGMACDFARREMLGISTK